MVDLKTVEKRKPAEQAPKSKAGGPRWRWQWLIAPLMGLSIFFHIALLFVPLPTPTLPEEDDIKEEVAEEEDAPIDILALSDIAAPEPLPEPPQEQPQQQTQAPPPPDAVPPPPDPQQVPEAPVENLPPVDDGFDENVPPSFDPVAATDQFIGDLSGLGVEEYTSQLGLPTPDLLRNPGNAGCFLDPGGGAVAGARVANWLDKEPQTLLGENLQEVYGPRGITFEELPPFCGERYFRGITAEGEAFMTFSLVTLNGSTLLVVWSVPPQ